MSPRFTSPPNPMAFNARVWAIVHQIPAGKVATYGQIADLIPPPENMEPKQYKAFGARWVGGAMASCPEGVPWHRVINSQGKVSLPRGSGHAQQRQLLEAEGVIFDDRERVDLRKYRWSGPREAK